MQKPTNKRRRRSYRSVKKKELTTKTLTIGGKEFNDYSNKTFYLCIPAFLIKGIPSSEGNKYLNTENNIPTPNNMLGSA